MEIDLYDHSRKAGPWPVSKRMASGAPMQWALDGVTITAKPSPYGLRFRIKFGDGRTCVQHSLAAAEEYADECLRRALSK